MTGAFIRLASRGRPDIAARIEVANPLGALEEYVRDAPRKDQRITAAKCCQLLRDDPAQWAGVFDPGGDRIVQFDDIVLGAYSNPLRLASKKFGVGLYQFSEYPIPDSVKANLGKAANFVCLLYYGGEKLLGSTSDSADGPSTAYNLPGHVPSSKTFDALSTVLGIKDLHTYFMPA